MKRTLTLATIALAGLTFAGCSTKPTTDTTPAPAPTTSSTTADPAPALPPPTTTKSQDQALRKAESYLTMTAFSQTGLVKQLMFEGFSQADAEWAAATVHADWNEQALKRGKSYLEMSAFSRTSLIKQLMFEGFTKAQATYAVDTIGL